MKLRWVPAGVVLAAALAWPAAVRSQSKEPLTHEALWLLKRVGAPAASPDGRWVAFPVTEPAYDEKNETSDLWIVPADGSAPARRLTVSRSSESAAAWSPDSRRIAFTAKREDDEVAQVYVIDVVAGGEARRATSSPLAARAPAWSPDGRFIAFQGAAYPGAGDADANAKIAAERKDAKSKVRIYETFPIRRWDKWLDDTQTHLFVVAADGADTVARDLLAGTQLVAKPGFGGPSGEGAGEDIEPEWAPDSRSIVFAAMTNRNESGYGPVNAHLFEVPVAGGEPRQLTAGNATYGGPAFAPNGKTLCYQVTGEWSKIYAVARVGCTTWPWSAPGPAVTSGFDRSVAEFAFSPDGRTLYLTAEDSGFVRLFSMPLRGGAVTPVLESRGVWSGIQARSGVRAPFLVAGWSSSTSPTEIVRVDPATQKQTPLTSINTTRAAELDWPPLQEFWSTNAQGRRMHSFIALPQSFDAAKKYPLLVLIHGGHANMWRDSITLRWNYQLIASPGYVVLMTDYRGSTGYGEQFTLDILGDPLRGPADDLNRAADEAIKRYPFIDGSRQAAGGASYGGHLANWLEASTTRYKCLISHAGLSSLQTQWSTSDTNFHRELMMGGPYWENPAVWMEQSPIAHAKDFRTPMLLSVGENDFRVPMNNALEMYAVLQRMRIPARLLVWPDENHWIAKGENSRVFYREVHAWLARWLNPSRPPS